MIIKNGKVLLGDFSFQNKDIRIENGIIVEIGDNLQGDEIIEADGKYVLPGFIDEHFHGAGGFTTSKGSSEDLIGIAKVEAKSGITTIVPTLSSYPDDIMFAFIEAAKKAQSSDYLGARIHGVHLEGPYLNPDFKGAHELQNLKKPTPEHFGKFIDAGEGVVKIVTIAPEMDENLETTKYAVSRGVKVEIGHTGATYEKAMEAIEAGATISTHTFNAMVSLHHRNPGVLGAVLTDDRVHAEVMGDFGHVAPAIVKLIYKAKGDSLVNFVSDSMLAAGFPDGEYYDSGTKNIVINGLSYLENGTINGSASTILKSVQNALTIGIPLESAVKMASYNPAVTLGIDNECGKIEEGFRADIIIADENISPEKVFVGGRLV